jgi:hypothetical protein
VTACDRRIQDIRSQDGTATYRTPHHSTELQCTLHPHIPGKSESIVDASATVSRSCQGRRVSGAERVRE